MTSEPRQHQNILQRYGLEACAAVLFGILLLATWRRFGDLLVDTPRELYHAWRVADGARPFLDFEHPHGAWALVFDGLIFRLFGSHSDVLFAANACLAALLTVALYVILRSGWGRLAANLTLIMIEVAFIFGGFLEAQIFNYIAPYNQSSLHAMLLATWGLAALALSSHWPQAVWLFLAGVANGCVLFTRADVALALTVTSLGALVVLLRQAPSMQRCLWLAGAFGTGFLLPCVAFAAYFSHVLPPQLFWRAMKGPWGVISPKTATTSRQLHHFGFDEPLANFARMLMWTGSVIAAAALAEGWIRLCAQSAPSANLRRWLVAFAFAFPLAPLATAWDLAANVLWFRLPWTLPVWTFLLWLLALRTLTHAGAPNRAAFTRALWASFALFMLARMPLNTRVYQYGFYQALPATALVFAWTAHRWIAPLAARAKSPPLPTILRGAFMAGTWFVFVLTALLTLYKNTRDRTVLIHVPGLSLYVPASPKKFQQTHVLLAGLRRMEQLTSAGASFAAVPEGTLYHYVLRRPHPTPFDHLAT
ncbi:MAG: hypothetical protein ACPL7D_12570, partial [Candidatus Sumerlaeaceae bacterium]